MASRNCTLVTRKGNSYSTIVWGKEIIRFFQRKNILRLELFGTCSTDKVVEAVEPEVSKTDALEEWCDDELESRCLVVLINVARIANAVQVTL